MAPERGAVHLRAGAACCTGSRVGWPARTVVAPKMALWFGRLVRRAPCYMDRRTAIPWCVGLGFAVLAASPAIGQELFDSGIDLVAQGLQRGAVVNVSGSVTADSDDRCAFRTQVLEAEAQRALRRDGVAASPWSERDSLRGNRYWTMDAEGNRLVAELTVDVIAFATGVRQCAVSVDIQLRVLGGSSVDDVAILAAHDEHLLVWTWPEHVTRIRTVVEEKVSVIANAVRSRAGAR